MMSLNGRWYVESNIVKSRESLQLTKNHLKSLCGLVDAILILELRYYEQLSTVANSISALNFSHFQLIQMVDIDANSILLEQKLVELLQERQRTITSIMIKGK